MDQKFSSCGPIASGYSYFEFLFRHIKVYREHAIIHDAAGKLQAHSGTVSEKCYIIGLGSNSFAGSSDWTTLFPLRKSFSAFLFQLYRLLRQYVWHFLGY